MSGADGSTGEAPAPSEPENLSAFVARVLNQLSLSAWLPGAFLIVAVSTLAWFRMNSAVTLCGAGLFVQHAWIPILVLAVPALVMATLLTQAFSFEAIRALEGYWPSGGPFAWLSHVLLRFRRWRKHAIERRYKKVDLAAFLSAKGTILTAGTDPIVVAAIEQDLRELPRNIALTDDQFDVLEAFKRHEHYAPWDMSKLLRLEQLRAECPVSSRLMPTRLGNVLRAAEDRLQSPGHVEGFVMRNRAVAPSRVLMHHDQFRTRLDMYCSLTFVAIVVAAVSIPMLVDVAIIPHVVITVIFVVIAWASYEAALASARGLSTAILEIDAAVRKSAVRPVTTQAETPGISLSGAP
jgi:hypothetical protein